MTGFLAALGLSALMALPTWAFLAVRALLVGRRVDIAARRRLARLSVAFGAISHAAILPLAALRGSIGAPFIAWYCLALIGAGLLLKAIRPGSGRIPGSGGRRRG
jgi:hypothetical protein